MLNPTSFYQNFIASRIAGPIPLLGISFDQFALKLSNAIFLWMYNQPQNVSLIGQTIGTAGTGVISPLASKLVLVYNPLPLQSSFTSFGLLGPTSQSLANCLSLGISNTINTLGQYSGTSIGVGVGTDVSVIGALNVPVLTAILQASLGTSVQSALLIPALTSGLSLYLQTMSGTAQVSGAPSNIASTGTSVSSIF